MAMIKCSECNSDISDEALACPNCGKPITKSSLTLNLFISIFIIVFVLPISIALYKDYERKVNRELDREEAQQREKASNQPNALLAKAQDLIAHKSYIESKEILNKIIEQHASSSEYCSASTLLESIQENVKHEQNDNKRKADKEKKDVDESIKMMSKKTDPVEKIDWYHDKSINQYPAKSNIYVYFGVSEKSILGPRVVFRYFDNNWVFYSKIKFKMDDETSEYIPSEVKRDNGSGYVWEIADIKCDDVLLEILEKITTSKNAIIRFVGPDKVADFTVTTSDKRAIKRTIQASQNWPIE